MKKTTKKSKPATPSAGMLPLIRKLIAAGKSDAEILKHRTPALPIRPGVVAYARRTGEKVTPAKAAPAKVGGKAPRAAR
jgi:hypothetical protein